MGGDLPSGVRLAELTREQSRRAADEGAIVLVPLGATEQHGPHLPLCTDTLHAEHVALQAAASLVPRYRVVVAPAVAYGCSPHHLVFGGTMSLTSTTLLAVLTDLGDSLAASGFRRVFFINGHGGNHHLAAQSAVDLAVRANVDAAAASWWHLAAATTVSAGALATGRVPGHAGGYETALVLALRPDLVRGEPLPHREERTAEYTFDDPLTLASRDAWELLDGWTDSPDRATAERGAEFLRLGVEALAVAVERFARATGLHPAPEPGALT